MTTESFENSNSPSAYASSILTDHSTPDFNPHFVSSADDENHVTEQPVQNSIKQRQTASLAPPSPQSDQEKTNTEKQHSLTTTEQVEAEVDAFFAHLSSQPGKSWVELAKESNQKQIEEIKKWRAQQQSIGS